MNRLYWKNSKNRKRERAERGPACAKSCAIEPKKKQQEKRRAIVGH